ncbi:hypothetical protein FACS189483_09550 [Spirochaetia bacterium]|nr:hypothetical protein FACS189483_09550 [Spirochaetia bacterium]
MRQQTADSRRYYVLVLTNIITLIFLMTIALHYKIPQKVLAKLGFTISGIYVNDVSLYDIKNDLFLVYNESGYEIVMLGDSITEGVSWNELLGINNIANRGIGGDFTDGFINRLTGIYKLRPEMCFIMGGINDLHHGITVEKILVNFERMIESMELHGITVIIQSTLYVSKERPKWEIINRSVNELNNGLQEICIRNDLLYLDVNNVVMDDGALNKKYTYDGIHLNGNGYNKWKELILTILGNRNI